MSRNDENMSYSLILSHVIMNIIPAELQWSYVGGARGGWNPHHPSSCHQWICNGEVQGEREGDAIPQPINISRWIHMQW